MKFFCREIKVGYIHSYLSKVRASILCNCIDFVGGSQKVHT